MWLSMISSFDGVVAVYAGLPCDLSKPNYIFVQSKLLLGGWSTGTAKYLSSLVDSVLQPQDLWIQMLI
jgi:hypothetical protein